MTDPRAILAANNNADWYEMMFDVHGLSYQRDAIGFRAIDPPPRYHGTHTWTAPDQQKEILDRVKQDLTPTGFGIKDSFATLDLTPFGLTPLIEAEWIWFESAPAADLTGWEEILSPEALLAFEAAWNTNGSPSDKRQFPDPILERSDVKLWARRTNGSYDAGCIANLSPNCVGLSNVFGKEVFPAAFSLAKGFGNGLPTVGYESGDALKQAKRAGCNCIGPLRVWVN